MPKKPDPPPPEPTVMHPAEVYIYKAKCNGKLFSDGTPPIYILPDGRFAAEWGGNWVIRMALRDLERVVRPKKAVKLMCPDNDSEPQVREVVSMTDNKLTDKDGRHHYRGYGPWLVYDEEILAKLAALRKKREKAKLELDKLDEEFDRICNTGTRVGPSNISEYTK